MTALTLRRTVRLPDQAEGCLLEAEHVTVEMAGIRIVDSISLSAHTGEVLALVGPNGAGKSTLLGALSGDVPVTGGRILLDGEPLAHWSARECALRRAVLPQQTTIGFPFTVLQVVRMGRAPWAGTDAEDDDDEVVAHALRDTDVHHLALRTFPTLSGGEKARAALARVLAQGPQILLLDEPTAALDIAHQEKVLSLARHCARRGHAVTVVLHDLGLAASYADRVALLVQGRIRAQGTPSEVFTSELLSEAYAHPIEVLRHPRTGELLVLPRRDALPLRITPD